MLVHFYWVYHSDKLSCLYYQSLMMAIYTPYYRFVYSSILLLTKALFYELACYVGLYCSYQWKGINNYKYLKLLSVKSVFIIPIYTSIFIPTYHMKCRILLVSCTGMLLMTEHQLQPQWRKLSPLHFSPQLLAQPIEFPLVYHMH
jgi:hypothetical protein